jgi:hypothetical protein
MGTVVGRRAGNGIRRRLKGSVKKFISSNGSNRSARYGNRVSQSPRGNIRQLVGSPAFTASAFAIPMLVGTTVDALSVVIAPMLG